MQSIAAITHVVVIFALDLEALKRLAFNKLAGCDRPRKHGVSLAVSLRSVLGGDRNRARLDLERNLALGGRTVDRHLIGNSQCADVLDLGGLGRPVLAIGAVLGRRALGQSRRIDRVICTVVLAGVANDGGNRNLDCRQRMPTDRALLMLGASLGCRGRLVDDPLKGVRTLVDLLTAGALVPVRIVVGEPLVAHSLVLVHALDRDGGILLDIAQDEPSALVLLEKHAVCLDSKVVARIVAIGDLYRELHAFVPLQLVRAMPRYRVRVIFLGKTDVQVLALADMHFHRRGRHVIIGLGIPDLVVASGKILNLTDFGNHGLAIGVPGFGAEQAVGNAAVRAFNLAVALATDGFGGSLQALGLLLLGLINRVGILKVFGRKGVILYDLGVTGEARHLCRIATGIDARRVLDLIGDLALVTLDDIGGLDLGALRLTVIGIRSDRPANTNLALGDLERAGLERRSIVRPLDLVPLVADLALLDRQRIGAHVLAGLTVNLEPGERVALNNRALDGFEFKVRIGLAVRLRSVLGPHRHRTGIDLKLDLALADVPRRKDRLKLDGLGTGIADERRLVTPLLLALLAILNRCNGLGVNRHAVPLAIVGARVALDAEGGDLDRLALVAARLAALMLGTGPISRSGLVDDPLKVMLCAVNVLLATGAGVPVFGVVVLPTATVGLLGAVLDLNRQGLGGVMVTVGLKANAVFAGGKTLNRRLAFGNPLIVAGGLGFPLVGVINPVDAAIRQSMPGRGRRLDVLGSGLIGGSDLNLKLALHRHVVGCGNTVLNCLGTHVVIDIARDIGIGGDSVFVQQATIDAIFDLHALGGVVDRHRRRVSLAVIGAVKALGLNILELRAVDAPVEKLAGVN